MISIKQIFLTNAVREVLASRYLKDEMDEIDSILNQIKDAKEIDPDTLSRIIELEKKKKKLKLLLRQYRKLNIAKARIAIIKAKSFVKRIFNSLGGFSIKAVAIYQLCKIILIMVEKVNQLLHRKSRNGSFLIGYLRNCGLIDKG